MTRTQKVIEACKRIDPVNWVDLVLLYAEDRAEWKRKAADATQRRASRGYDSSIPDRQKRIGTVGSCAVGYSSSPAVILEEARRAGVTYTNGLARWLRDHHPAQAAEVIELARNTMVH